MPEKEDTPSPDSSYTYEALELLRTRELYTYYEPTITPSYSDDEYHDTYHHDPKYNLSSSEDTDQSHDTWTGKPLTAGDPVLGSLVLLAERLLGADRAVVVFADQHREYLVADSAQAITHFTGLDTPESVDADMFPPTGASRKRIKGRVELFSVFLDTPMRKKGPRKVEEVLIKDLAVEHKWKGCWPTMTRFAGMPICTKSGSVIGVLCACYEDPDPGDVDRVQYTRTFQTLSRSVMRYMDVVRGEREKKRGRRMEIALSRFIAGNYSPDKVPLTGQADGSIRVETADEESSRFDDERVENTKQRRKTEREKWEKRAAKRKHMKRDRQYSGEVSPKTPVSAILEEPGPEPPSSLSSNESAAPKRKKITSYFDPDAAPKHPAEEEDSKFESLDSDSPVPFLGNYGVQFKAPHDRSPPLPIEQKKDDSNSPPTSFDPQFLTRQPPTPYFLPDDESSTRIRESRGDGSYGSTTSTIGSLPMNVATHHRTLFMRAAELMHDAMAIDGVCFANPDLEGLLDFTVPGEARRDSLNHISSDAVNAEAVRGNRSIDSRQRSGIIGFSAHRPATSPGAAGVDAAQLTEAYLRNLTESWPRGCIFAWSRDATHPVIGVTVDPEGTSDVEGHFVHEAPENLEIVNVLRRFLPGSRSVMFIPLYDYVGKVFAVGFAWTCSGVRVLRGDVEGSFMAAFCDSIMTEVSRLQSISANVAKSNFISTISHELRSPLHGILASCELFTESILSSYERDLISTITSCGRTLLDTIENVLSFTKLNTRANLRKHQGNKTHEKSFEHVTDMAQELTNLTPEPLEKDVDLAALIEEVAEAAYVGYRFSETPEPKRPNSNRRSGGGRKDDVYVIVEVDPGVMERRFVIPPGAFRRVALNLMTNALKYTDEGWVRVCLYMKGDKTILSVADSGRGISREFLKNSLFTPFMQEMNLHSGTGLGMSIVRQLVDELAGTIDVSSQVDVGTEVCVTLKLDSHIPSSPSPTETDIRAAREILGGKIACLLGFDINAPLGDGSHGNDGKGGLESVTLKGAGDAQKAIYTYLVNTLTKLLGMQIVPAPRGLEALAVGEVDIAITRTREDVDRFLEALENGDEAAGVTQGNVIPIMELGRGRLGRPVSPNSPKRVRNKVVNLSRPYGVRKLAKVVGAAVCAGAGPGDDAAPRRHPPTPPSSTSLKQTTTTPTAPKETASPTFSTPLPRPPELQPATSLVPAQNRKSICQYTKSKLPSVLIVEDNQINMKLLSTFFERSGYHYTKAGNGLEAYRLVQERWDKMGDSTTPCEEVGFDVILMDLQMPIMTGTEATRAIRALEAERLATFSSSQSTTTATQYPPQKATIIALTALSNLEARLEAKRAGTDMFLVKPVKIAELREIMIRVQEARKNVVEERKLLEKGEGVGEWMKKGDNPEERRESTITWTVDDVDSLLPSVDENTRLDPPRVDRGAGISTSRPRRSSITEPLRLSPSPHPPQLAPLAPTAPAKEMESPKSTPTTPMPTLKQTTTCNGFREPGERTFLPLLSPGIGGGIPGGVLPRAGRMGVTAQMDSFLDNDGADGDVMTRDARAAGKEGGVNGREAWTG